MARAGCKVTFKEGRDDLRIYAGIQLSAKDVERVPERIGEEMEAWSQREREELCQSVFCVCREEVIPVLYVSYDGVGVPMTPAELVGRRGKQADGSARTLEAKVGCVCMQTTTNLKGFPVREPESASFVAAIESSDESSWRIYGEAVRRGLYAAQRVVMVADVTEWIRTMAGEHFPDALQIIDLYKNGLRELRFVAGVEEREIWQLIDIIVRIENINQLEDDLLALIWEADFIHIGYLATDEFLDEMPALIPENIEEFRKNLVFKPVAHNVDYDLVDGEEEEEVDLYEILSRKENESPTIDANRSLYFLTHDELERLRGEVKAETTPGALCSVSSASSSKSSLLKGSLKPIRMRSMFSANCWMPFNPRGISESGGPLDPSE